MPRSLQTCQHHPSEVRLVGSGNRPQGQGSTHCTHLPADPDAAAGVLEPPRYLRSTAGAWGRGAPAWQQSRPVVLLASPQPPTARPSRPPCHCCSGRLRHALAMPLLSTLPIDPLAESAALSHVAGPPLRRSNPSSLLMPSATPPINSPSWVSWGPGGGGLDRPGAMRAAQVTYGGYARPSTWSLSRPG